MLFNSIFEEYYGERYKDLDFLNDKMTEVAAVAEVMLQKSFIRK